MRQGVATQVRWGVRLEKQREPPVEKVRGTSDSNGSRHSSVAREPKLRFTGNPRTDRARELAHLGFRKRAEDVSNCECEGTTAEDRLEEGACGWRECPTCGVSYALRLREELETAMASMKRFFVIRLDVPLDEGTDLPQAWNAFRGFLRRMRFAMIHVRVIGVTYPDIFGVGPSSLCAELIVAGGRDDKRRVKAKWARYTAGEGTAGLIDITGLDSAGVAKRLTPTSRWLPQPGRVQLDLLRDFWRAMWKRWWKVDWRRAGSLRRAKGAAARRRA